MTTYFWQGSANSSPNDGDNWLDPLGPSTGTAPADGDSIVFDSWPLGLSLGFCDLLPIVDYNIQEHISIKQGITSIYVTIKIRAPRYCFWLMA